MSLFDEIKTEAVRRAAQVTSRPAYNNSELVKRIIGGGMISHPRGYKDQLQRRLDEYRADAQKKTEARKNLLSLHEELTERAGEQRRILQSATAFTPDEVITCATHTLAACKFRLSKISPEDLNETETKDLALAHIASTTRELESRLSRLHSALNDLRDKINASASDVRSDGHVFQAYVRDVGALVEAIDHTQSCLRQAQQVESAARIGDSVQAVQRSDWASMVSNRRIGKKESGARAN
jgi:uncharacterized protein YoxC